MNINPSWLVAAVAVALLALGGSYQRGKSVGYGDGYKLAESRGKTALEREKRDREEENTRRAKALAEAEEWARKRLEYAMGEASAMETSLLSERKERASERAELTRRIAHVSKTASITCAGLPATWVREYNKALGLGDSPLPGDAGGLAPDGALATAGVAVSGLPSGTPLTSSAKDGSAKNGQTGNKTASGTLTSPEDVLAHIRDVGIDYRQCLVKVAGWQQTYRNWRKIQERK